MILGQDIRVFVNADSTNKTVNSKAFILVEQLNAFPVLAFKTATTNLETFDSEWNSKLCEEISTEDIKISVNTILDDESEAVMQEAFSDSDLIQVKIEVSDEVNTYYYILNGYISNVSNSGDKDKVHVSTYTFSPDELVGNGYYVTPDYLVEGDGGVLSNGGTIPTPLGTNQTGNSFIKIDSTESVTGTDLLGIVNIDNQDHTALTITKSGSLHAYVENTSNSAELYTTKNKPTSSDVGTYDSATIDSKISTVSDEIDSLTVNGYKITDAPVLNANDVSALPITGGTLTGALEVLGSANIITMKNTEEGDSNFISGVGHDGAERWYIGNTKSSDNVFISNDIAENSIELVSDGSIKLSTGQIFTFNTDGTFEPASYENLDSRYVPSTATINGYLVNTNPVLVAGDVNAYTKEEVNQIIAGETTIGVTSINGEMGDVVLDYDDVNAVSDLCTINGKLLSSNAVLTFSDVNAVSDACTVNGKLLSSNAVLTASDVSALPISGGTLTGLLTVPDINVADAISTPTINTTRINSEGGVVEFGLGFQETSDSYIDVHTTYPEIDFDYRIRFFNAGNEIDFLYSNGAYANINTGNLLLHGQFSLYGVPRDTSGNGLIENYDNNGKLAFNYGYYGDSFNTNFYDANGVWESSPLNIDRTGHASFSNNITCSWIYANSANGAGAFASQYSTDAPFINQFSSTSTSEYHPLWKQRDTQNGRCWSGGMLITAESFDIQYIDYQGNQQLFSFGADGTLNVPSGIYSNAGVYDRGNLVYSPWNPPPASSTTSAALGTNGWWKDNSTGRITQWGSVSGTGNGVVINFPIAFTSACVNLQLTHAESTQVSSSPEVETLATTYATMNVANNAYKTYWTAIGY